MANELSGKTILITGATGGIGKVTATELARMGAHVVLVSRDEAKGRDVAAEIGRSTAGATLDVLRADLSVMKEIVALAAEFKRRFDRLDVLVNNAGAIFMQRELTADGLERTFATNHLAYFLLTRELLDVLKATGPARVVSVASDAHRRGRMHFDDLMLEKGYGGWKAYGQSKLANILFTRELARRLDGTRVTANCLHPGVVATGFGQNRQSWMKLAVKLASPFLITPEKGAETTIYLASSPEVEGRTGGYYQRKKEVLPSRAARDDAAARRLWDESEQILARVLGEARGAA